MSDATIYQIALIAAVLILCLMGHPDMAVTCAVGNVVIGALKDPEQ